MSTFTEHYSLIMPSQEDYYDVQDFNENTEALDGLLYEQETAIANVGEKVDGVAEKIGSPGDEGEDTLFGALGKKGSEIFYRPSANVRKSLEPRNLVNSPSTEKSDNLKLMDFTALHDGMIAVKVSTSSDSVGGGNSVTFTCWEYTHLSLYNAPELSSMNRPSSSYTAVLSLPMGLGNYSHSFVMPVQKGHTYQFHLSYAYQNLFDLNYFQILYDETELT